MEKYEFIKFKLQVSSLEFIIAISIFLLVILISFAIQLNKLNEILAIYDDFSIMKDLNTLEIIFDIEGKPKDWNLSNFEVIGLRSEGKVSFEKISYLKDIEYKTLKEKLMIRNEFCLLDFNIGNCSFEKSKKIFTSEKIVPIEINNTVNLQKVKIVVWN